MQKQPYRRPELRTHGDIKAVTLANESGVVLDMDFSAGTPINEVTLS